MKSKTLFLFSCIIFLTLLGLILLFSSSFFMARQQYGDPYHYIRKQTIIMFLGLIICIIATQIPYKIWHRLAWPIYLASLLSLALVFVPFIGKSAGGARRWIEVAGFSFQPSDISKFAVILLICRIYTTTTQLNVYVKSIISLFIIAIPTLLISLEPDFGTAFHLLISLVFLLFLTEFPFFILLLLSINLLPILYYAVIKVPWRFKRLLAFLDPWRYRFEEGYQLVASFKAFIAGGIWGKGIGEGAVRHTFQARHTDFILAIVAENLGFVGIVMILLLYTGISILGFVLIHKKTDLFGQLLGAGIILLFFLQANIHIAVNMGLLPTTGINLPLVSYGGTSLITYLGLFGIFINISKTE